MVKKSQIFLKSIAPIVKHLNKESITSAVLEIGCGKGIISRYLYDRFKIYCGVQIDQKFQTNLSGIEKIIYRDFKQYYPLPGEKYDLLVSNLPFRDYLSLIFHTLKVHPEIHSYYVIVQEEVAEQMLKGKRKIGKIIRHHFEVTKLEKLDRYYYEPIPKVDTSLLLLKPIRQYDKRIEFLRIIRPGKKIAELGKSFYQLTPEQFEQLLNNIEIPHSCR